MNILEYEMDEFELNFWTWIFEIIWTLGPGDVWFTSHFKVNFSQKRMKFPVQIQTTI